MTTLLWIIGSGLLMSLIALVGSATLLISPAALERCLLPLVALAAGSLIGGALFHMIPAALAAAPSDEQVWLALLAGFCSFLAIEQLLHWHHCHRAGAHRKKPLVWFLIPFAAGNFLYIGAVDLVPEVNKTPSTAANLLHFAAFVVGAAIMFAATALD